MMEVLRDTVRQQRLLGAREHIIHPSAANPPFLSSALPPTLPLLRLQTDVVIRKLI